MRAGFLRITLLLLVLLRPQALLAEQVELQWIGHSMVRITSVSGKIIVIDPATAANPRLPARLKDLSALGNVDLILITHGHLDHLADVPRLAKLTGARVVANHGLANSLVALGLVEGSRVISMNKGGTVEPIGGGIKIHMVPAEHSSHLDIKGLNLDGPVQHRDGGTAVGYVVELENNFRIYHSGDTDVFGDMALIQKFYKPDLALVCIGGHYTMDPERAAFALREFIRPRLAIPIHYGTYPLINRTPAELKAALQDAPIKVLDLSPGDAVKF